MQVATPLTTLIIAVDSAEYLRVPVETFSDGTVPADPTGLPVRFAFLGSGLDPISGDWRDGSWQTLDGIYHARILVTPSAWSLAKGTLRIWLRIVGATEQPQAIVGSLKVT